MPFALVATLRMPYWPNVGFLFERGRRSAFE
jgi:hypothetical protein